jgi:PIN domain nuclease of toxin-antitoxin system
MNLLADTHIWLWSHLEPKRLSRRVARALLDSRNDLWLSPISLWETLLLCKKGRIVLNSPSAWISAAMEKAPFREAPLTHEVALATEAVHLVHPDPADRFLAATAMVYGLMLVTSDENLIGGTGYAVVANRR